MIANAFLGSYQTLNPLKIYTERIAEAQRNMVNDLDCEGIQFHVSKNDYSKTEQKNSIWINVFCYENVFCCENNLVYPVHI